MAVIPLPLSIRPPGPESGLWPSPIHRLLFTTAPPDSPSAVAPRPSGLPHRRPALLAPVATVGSFHAGWVQQNAALAPGSVLALPCPSGFFVSPRLVAALVAIPVAAG